MSLTRGHRIARLPDEQSSVREESEKKHVMADKEESESLTFDFNFDYSFFFFVIRRLVWTIIAKRFCNELI